MPKPTRRVLSVEEKRALARVMESIDAATSKHLTPALENIETGPGTSIDFDTLARVMVRLRADYLQGDLSDQVAAFEREVVAMELNPSSKDFERVRYALDTIGVLARVFDGREWTPGREDLTPLFDIDELAAS